VSPEGWQNDKGPSQKSKGQIVIYELHVRDFSIDTASGMINRGKYLAFTEQDTRGSKGESTGLSHIANLGITHIHLLPVFDFASIDETKPNDKYNWGYEPQNYFVPEGSYATHPRKPSNRIMEFKSMVQSIHAKGMGVIMDVVYNHTYYLDNSLFQEWAPGYYYRQWEDGKYSNASGCGNEIATEKEKVRDMIIASLVHWTKVYHIDGFRFDLMGIMDLTTMTMLRDTLEKIRPGIILYGEGWTAGNSPS
jgi:pullulanase